MNKRFVFVLATVFVTASFCGAANLAVNSSFETTEITSGGPPTTYGDWNGDYSSIVGATSGINPLGGSKMLQFLGTSYGDGGSGVTAEVQQIIDISSYRSLISAGQATASASAYFNRVAGDSQTDTLMYLVILAYAGDPSSFPTQYANNSYLAVEESAVFTDSDPITWEQASCQLTLPTNTDFIVIGLNASENVYNDTFLNEFDGHFADMASVEIVPEPATLLLLGLGTVMLKKRVKPKVVKKL